MWRTAHVRHSTPRCDTGFSLFKQEEVMVFTLAQAALRVCFQIDYAATFSGNTDVIDRAAVFWKCANGLATNVHIVTTLPFATLHPEESLAFDKNIYIRHQWFWGFDTTYVGEFISFHTKKTKCHFVSTWSECLAAAVVYFSNCSTQKVFELFSNKLWHFTYKEDIIESKQRFFNLGCLSWSVLILSWSVLILSWSVLIFVKAV